MKIDIGESLVNSYLRHVKNCNIVQLNWKPSGKWIPEPDLYEQVEQEYERIQRHQAFSEIFKTNFEQTIRQTEIDMLGLDQQDTLYAANVAFNENGINYGPKTDTRNRVIKNLLRAHLALSYYFPGKKHVLLFCSPKVSAPTEEIIKDYFKVLNTEFSSPEVQFRYLSNENFRDNILLETIDCTQNEFDTSELFLRSFKLLTIFGQENDEESGTVVEKKEKVIVKKQDIAAAAPDKASPEESLLVSSNEKPGEETAVQSSEKPLQAEHMGESPADQVPEKPAAPDENARELIEIAKVKNRIPRWFLRPNQNNSRILITYMKLLEKSEIVSIGQLAEACKDVPNFTGNYAQMINIAEKNHGKVFNGTSENIQLWEPVREFIIQEYINSKKSYYE